MNLSKKQEYLIIAGLLVLIFPFFALLLYVHPQGDDFFFAYKMQNQGVFDFVKEMYFTWSGRYFSMFLGALDPWKYESILFFRLYLGAYQVIFIFSLYTFIKQIFTSNTPKTTIIIIVFFIYLIFIQTIPDILQLLYWYPSVSAYTLGASLFLLFISNAISNYIGNTSNKKYLILNSILSMLIVGSNELFIIPLGISFITIIFLKYKYKKTFINDIYITLIMISFSLLVILAPGNYQRIEWYSESISIANALVLSIKSFIYVGTFYFQNFTFILTSILLILLFKYFIIRDIIRRINISRNDLILSILLSLITLSIILFPATYSLKCVPSYRVLNHLSFFLFLLWIINIILISNFLVNFSQKREASLLIKILFAFIFVSMISGVYIKDIYLLKEKKLESLYLQGNFLKVTYTLLFEAETYNIEISERHRAFSNAKANNIHNISMKALTYQPEVLVEMPCKNIKLINPIPKFIFFRERQYFNLDTIYCINDD